MDASSYTAITHTPEILHRLTPSPSPARVAASLVSHPAYPNEVMERSAWKRLVNSMGQHRQTKLYISPTRLSSSCASLAAAAAAGVVAAPSPLMQRRSMMAARKVVWLLVLGVVELWAAV